MTSLTGRLPVQMPRVPGCRSFLDSDGFGRGFLGVGGGNEGVDWVGRGSYLLTGGKVNGVGDSSDGMELDGTWGLWMLRVVV